jgi:diguanylate cyclase (GGDEF)-like protein
VNDFAAYVTLLEKASFTVVGVAGGMRARVKFRDTRPHVVIIATDLRGISHVELTRMLLSADPSVSIVFIGAEAATTQWRSEALTAGAFDYFSLPSDSALLIARLNQLVEIKNQLDTLRAAADCDYLTGLANRRRFRAALGNEVERWRRYTVPCALLLLDIDFLKRINDAHGHSAGDSAIRRVADHLHEFSRDNDTPARLGGEEFALLLAGATEAQAATVAERVRQAVSASPVENIGIVTVSLGVAACPTHATSERLLYAASDAALYRAKQAGRNRSEIAPAIL